MIVEALLFFTIALVYSSAGFGGGSMYIVVLSQTHPVAAFVRFTALLCNALVTTTGTIQFGRQGWLTYRPVLLLLACSVPACVYTSTWKLEGDLYFLLLACCLLLSGVAMLIQKQSDAGAGLIIHNHWWHYPASIFIGAVSGLTGIGGGVYLAPLLHLSRWGSPKHIAAATSCFILVNSVVSLLTRILNHDAVFESYQFVLAGCVLAGGLTGSRISSSLFSQKAVRYVTVIIIIFAASKILWEKL